MQQEDKGLSTNTSADDQDLGPFGSSRSSGVRQVLGLATFAGNPFDEILLLSGADIVLNEQVEVRRGKKGVMRDESGMKMRGDGKHGCM